MKKSEWDRRKPLDLDGVQLLGAALYLKACRWSEHAKEQARARQEAEAGSEPVSEFEWPRDVEHYQHQHQLRDAERRELKSRLIALDTPESAYEGARNLCAKDFQFRWDHLKKHKILLGYISDDQPSYAIGWDRETPISERWGGTLSSALLAIFGLEFERLTGSDPDLTPLLSEQEDILFHLSVWKVCGPERGRGQPSGRRWADGLEKAASYAYSLFTDAAEDENPITKEEAIRRSLSKFTVIGSEEFKDFPDKESAIVSDALSEGGRMDGAIKAVRKQLNAWFLGENSQN